MPTVIDVVGTDGQAAGRWPGIRTGNRTPGGRARRCGQRGLRQTVVITRPIPAAVRYLIYLTKLGLDLALTLFHSH